MLSKEFISQFKAEADVSKLLKQLHAQVLEKMPEGEMDAHLGYEKNSVAYRAETERPEESPWHVGWQIGKFFFLDGCFDRFKSPWSAGYTDLPAPTT